MMQSEDAPTGYLHPAYAHSFEQIGTPLRLPRSGGWLICRQIPCSHLCDAMGCYPLFSCLDWRQLNHDLESLAPQLVSVVLVTDPFGDYDLDLLYSCFPDVLLRFKEHFVVDLSLAGKAIDLPRSVHHRRKVRKAATSVEVHQVETPSQYLDEWEHLYAHLRARHHIRGIAAFSRQAFCWQLRVPGVVMLRALHQGSTVGATLWYVHGEVAYYHLGAYNEVGYQLSASYALFDQAISFFRRISVRWLDLGAGAGLQGERNDGLVRFKAGWATGTRPVYLCGRILNPHCYARLANTMGGTTTYFPAYRHGEFA